MKGLKAFMQHILKSNMVRAPAGLTACRGCQWSQMTGDRSDLARIFPFKLSSKPLQESGPFMLKSQAHSRLNRYLRVSLPLAVLAPSLCLLPPARVIAGALLFSYSACALGQHGSRARLGEPTTACSPWTKEAYRTGITSKAMLSSDGAVPRCVPRESTCVRGHACRVRAVAAETQARSTYIRPTLLVPMSVPFWMLIGLLISSYTSFFSLEKLYAPAISPGYKSRTTARTCARANPTRNPVAQRQGLNHSASRKVPEG
ncbi:hypothetical protein FB451DRAFT_1368742 [Mycena latifolia]|nr:hypothetical protein FB451DRAFT_1368742 [Mycena latifolia]